MEHIKKEMEELSKKIIPILVDFDGTVVRHDYPNIGKENEHAVEVLKKWTSEYNVGIILHTMRDGELLKAAADWFAEKGVPLYGIGRNPTQDNWTKSLKAYGLFCIDDINVGCPLIYEKGQRPRVDWLRVNEIVEPILIAINKK